MSRWDALRSENQRCDPKKSFSRRPPARQWERRSEAGFMEWQRQLAGLSKALNEENQDQAFIFIEKLNAIHDSKPALSPKSAGDAVMVLCSSDSLVAEEKRLELACRILVNRKVLLKNHQVKQCVDSLTDCQEPCRIECLSRLVLIASRQMPAEETAKELVANLLLPAIEYPSNKRNVLVVMDALHCLASDPLHASALLAPLTLDISAAGQEETLTNPLQCRLLRALQSLLGNKLYSYRACTCLVTVIKAKNTAGDATNEIDISMLMPFLIDAARETNKSRQETALELLRVVLKTCPTSSTSLSGLFIGDGRLPVITPCTRCLHCGHETFSPLMDLLHDADDEIVSSIVPCVQELLQAMPLRLWVGTSGSRLQHFGRRTSEALVRLMQIVQCRFEQRPSVVPALCPLLGTILTEIPFVEDENDEITCQAMRLLSSGASVLMNYRNGELVECFAKCMGGRPQPQGGLAPIPLPMRLWLSSILSQDFRNFIWNSLEEKRDAREDAMQILCSIVRSSPSFVFVDQATWERCQQVIIEHIGDASFQIKLGGLTLLEHVLTGRMEKNPETVGDKSIALFATSIAFDMLKCPKPFFRTTTLKCFGAFLSQDWLDIFKLSADAKLPSFQDHVNAILFHCTQPNECSASVRSAACKCIGSICTNYLCDLSEGEGGIDSRDEERRVFCASVCKTLLISLQDSNVVKESAIFAIGNLAHALRDCEKHEPMLPFHLVRPLCEMVYTCLLEKKGRLVSHAIRTTGHLISLAFNPPYIDSGAMKDWDFHSFYGSVLQGLDAKVEMVLALEVCNGFSWKERARINKNGWGACNSLALVLDCNEATEPTNAKLAQDSLGLLVQCIAKSDLVHEKVASSATAAIRRQSVNTLSRISGESGIVGLALSPCLLQLYQIKKLRQSKTKRLANELELLLEHVLRATSISDACYLLKQDGIEKNALAFLYDWMVDANMPVSSFEAFALALQRRDLYDDASLQQKFASRALQLNRTTTGDDPDEL